VSFRPPVSGRTTAVLLGLLAVVGVLVAALWWRGRAPVDAGGPGARPVLVFGAAGLQKPLDEGATAYAAVSGRLAMRQFRASGTLLADIELAKDGDLFIPADETYIAKARAKGLIREVIPLARQTPVIGVAAGNPKRIAALSDLLRSDVRVALAADSASIGRISKAVLEQAGLWGALNAKLVTLKPTVADLATDLRLGVYDAAIVWDATVAQHTALAAIALPELSARAETVSAAVLSASTQPAAALALARFLAAPTTGNPIFARHGYAPIAGDRWAARPEITLYSGAVNKPAITKALQAFSEREGVHITTKYNGCGILCADMKDLAASTGAAGFPDAYFACDLCFVPPVAEFFPEAVMLSETDIVIAVPVGNPKGIRSLVDLAQPGLRLGVSHAEQATLGFMTKRLLEATGLYQSVMRNVVTQTPVGDLLVAQMRLGKLDAVIVYATNLHGQAEHFEQIALNHPAAKAVQPFAVAKDSSYRQLTARLLDHLKANRAAFEGAGFRWRGDEPAVKSSAIPLPEALGGKPPPLPAEPVGSAPRG